MLENKERVYLEKLKLATQVLLELGEDDGLTSSLESELWVFQDSVDRALLQLPG
ncbi:MAG: hypothetical protein FWE35_25035 [Streptosporangiales bacterium]|nr:hypothetical protein [Streptosporangiales bacterium]